MNPPKRFLAVGPGTRELGVAVLEEGELVYYAVKNVTDRRSPSTRLAQVREIIGRVIEREEPGALVMRKRSVQGRRSALLVRAEAEIRQLARRNKVEVLEIEWQVVRSVVAGSQTATKREIMEAVCSRFKELKRYRRPPLQYSHRYWGRLFDAVALSLAASS